MFVCVCSSLFVYLHHLPQKSKTLRRWNSAWVESVLVVRTVPRLLKLFGYEVSKIVYSIPSLETVLLSVIKVRKYRQVLNVALL